MTDAGCLDNSDCQSSLGVCCCAALVHEEATDAVFFRVMQLQSKVKAMQHQSRLGEVGLKNS